MFEGTAYCEWYGSWGGEVILDGIRKQVQQTIGRKPVNSVLQGLCFSFCLWITALSSLHERGLLSVSQTNSSPPSSFKSQCPYHNSS